MTTLISVPGYLDFVATYAPDLGKFAREVVGQNPSMDQDTLYQEVSRSPTAKVSVSSGTGTGKTAAFGVIAIWHLLCFPVACYEGKIEIGSNTYIGAPNLDQVAEGIWKEMHDCKLRIQNGPNAWIADYFEITKTKVYVRGFDQQWYISQVAMQKGKSVGIAGKHRYNQLIIIDEAAGVPDEHFDVIDGTQTQGGNRTILASQGVRNAGRFYETHHSLNVENGGSWVALRFNSENSPFVTDEWLANRSAETGGRDSVEYKIRVLGLFAENSDAVLLTRAESETMFNPEPIISDDESWGWMLLGDVGMGEYRDDSVMLAARVAGEGDFGLNARRVEIMAIPIITNAVNEIDYAGNVVNLFGKTDNASLYIDNGGVGATVNKLIERSGVPVNRVDWGKPCFRKEYKDRFYNLRACAMVRWRDAVKQGRFRVRFSPDKRLREKILNQASRIPYHFAEAGGLKYVIDRKEEMRKSGIKSPDIIDAMSFAFLEGATYAPTSGTSELPGDRKQAALKRAKDAFGDVE